MPMVMRRMRVRRARSVARAPRLSHSTTSVVRLEKAGIDLVPRLITSVLAGASTGINAFTFSANLDGAMAFNPVNYLYTTSASFIA